MDAIEFMCPAKVNLFLEVLGKRADGFHDIETVFLPVGLYDSVSFRKKPSGIDVFCDSPLVPSGEGNIVFKAVKMLFEKAGFRGGGVEVRIRKEIPAGSGMGGGSSDAAAALAACNLLFSLGFTKDDLAAAGGEAGADVPFFISLLDEDMRGFSGGAYLGRGRGGELESAGNPPELWITSVYPGFPLSTADIYGNLRLTGGRRGVTMMLEHIRSKNTAGVASSLFNRLEGPASCRSPVIKDIKHDLMTAGALGAVMTGSGSAVFGVAPDESRALEIRDRILSMRRGVNAYVTRGLQQGKSRQILQHGVF